MSDLITRQSYVYFMTRRYDRDYFMSVFEGIREPKDSAEIQEHRVALFAMMKEERPGILDMLIRDVEEAQEERRELIESMKKKSNKKRKY